MDTFIQDVKYALRQLVRQPVVTVIAVLTLALGIGANTAIFTVLNRAVLRSLPVPDPDRISHLVTFRGADGTNYNHSYTDFIELRRELQPIARVTAHSQVDAAVETPQTTERLSGAGVASGFFTAFGVRLTRGRDFAPEEEPLGSTPTVVIGDALWKELGGNDAVLGSALRINGVSFTVVGVAPRSFRGLIAGQHQQFWVTFGGLARLSGWVAGAMTRGSWLDVFARTEQSATQAQLTAAVERFDAAAVAARRRPNTYQTQLRDGSRGMTHLAGAVERPLWVLMSLVVLVLLLACANVANLLLVRAESRRREIAVRLAMGANRGRLVRQMLTESVALSLLGGAAGLVVAFWGMQLLLTYAPTGHSRLALGGAIDGTMLAFTAASSLLAAVAFGLAPALRASRASLVPALKGGQGGRQDRLFGLRGVLVVTQVAICLVLLCAATVFTRSVQNLAAVDVGYSPDSVLLASIDFEQAGYDRARGSAALDALLERLRQLPGARTVSAANVITPNPGGWNWSGMRLEGYTPPPGQSVDYDANRVDPKYFEAMGVRIVSGRGFDATDVRGAPFTMIVNEAFVRRYSPNQSVLGRRILDGDPPNQTVYEIIGVANDGKYRDVREENAPNVYMPLAQFYTPHVTLIARTAGAPQRFAPALQQAVRAFNPALPAFNIKTLEQHVASATAQDRMVANLASAFGTLALGLAALGLFGVMAFRVAQRTREIGVRVALGAREANVVRLMLTSAGALIGLGVAAGLAGALALGQFAESMLFGVGSADPLALAIAVAVLITAGLGAAWLPARRAARVDPMVALRAD